MKNMKKYDNLALLIHPMYSIITDIYRNTTGLGKITFKEMEPEYLKRLKVYKESISAFKNTNTLFVVVEPTRDLASFKLEEFYNFMMEELYSFARKELAVSFKRISDINFSSQFKKITPQLKKKIGVFSFGEHRKLYVKSFNEFTINFLKENNFKPIRKGIQIKFSFDIENKRDRRKEIKPIKKINNFKIKKRR
jgi:hypothetical protein